MGSGPLDLCGWVTGGVARPGAVLQASDVGP
jgi:hypothetical protein